MWIPRQHVPVMVATFVVPLLAVAAVVVVPLPRAAENGRCPHCGRGSPDDDHPRADSGGRGTRPAPNATTASWDPPARD